MKATAKAPTTDRHRDETAPGLRRSSPDPANASPLTPNPLIRWQPLRSQARFCWPSGVHWALTLAGPLRSRSNVHCLAARPRRTHDTKLSPLNPRRRIVAMATKLIVALATSRIVARATTSRQGHWRRADESSIIALLNGHLPTLASGHRRVDSLTENIAGLRPPPPDASRPCQRDGGRLRRSDRPDRQRTFGLPRRRPRRPLRR